MHNAQTTDGDFDPESGPSEPARSGTASVTPKRRGSKYHYSGTSKRTSKNTDPGTQKRKRKKKGSGAAGVRVPPGWPKGAVMAMRIAAAVNAGKLRGMDLFRVLAWLLENKPHAAEPELLSLVSRGVDLRDEKYTLNDSKSKKETK